MPLAIPNPSNPHLVLDFVDDWQDTARAFTVTGARRRWQVTLAAGIPELRLCLAYTDAPARGLQNNVNLLLQHAPSNTKWVGNQSLPGRLTALDVENNVEVIRVINPAPGTYYVQVLVSNLLHAPQDFALVATAEDLPELTEI